MDAHGRPLLSGWKFWLAMAFLVVVAALTARLGFWQLSRAAQKQEIAASVASGREAGFLQLEPGTPQTELVAWRQAAARGVWLPDYTVLLNNRNQEGKPGYWVVTPLCLQSLDAPEPEVAGAPLAVDCERAVAVLRGWVPRPAPGASADVLPAIPTLPQVETIDGDLLERIPRLFDLALLQGEEAAGPALEFGIAERIPLVQNLELEAYAEATGLELLPVVLQQVRGSGSPALVRNWAGPPVDVNQHRGYALQWFSFSAIALIALGVLIVKAIFNRRRRN